MHDTKAKTLAERRPHFDSALDSWMDRKRLTFSEAVASAARLAARDGHRRVVTRHVGPFSGAGWFVQVWR